MSRVAMTIAFVISLCLFGAWMGSMAKDLAYRQGYLDGYHHRQVENLPSIGIDNSKTPAPYLLGKG